jgi:hypothetical protein
MRLDYLFAAIGIGAAAAFISSTKAPTLKSSKTTTSSGNAVMAVTKGGTAMATATEPNMYGFIDSWNGSELFEEPGTTFNWVLDSGKGPIVRYYDKEYLGKFVGEQGDKVYQFETTSKSGKKVRFWVPKSEVKLMDAAGRDKFLLGDGKTPAQERYTKLINFFYS